jgi:hypothetical protein
MVVAAISMNSNLTISTDVSSCRIVRLIVENQWNHLNRIISPLLGLGLLEYQCESNGLYSRLPGSRLSIGTVYGIFPTTERVIVRIIQSAVPYGRRTSYDVLIG